MKIKKIIIKILPTALLISLVAVISFSFISCSSDNDVNEEVDAVNTVNLHFNLSLQSLTRTAGTRATEAGSSEENAISSYKIYFFDNDNKYIATFNANSFTPSDEENSSYSVSGAVEDSIIKYLGSGFKIMTLANWSTYPSDMVRGTTTIDDICNAETAVFACPTTFDTIPSIPFYGVHTYKYVPFTSVTNLSDPIILLRAMAKIEVIDKNISTRTDYYLSTIKSAKIYHYNEKGYCAPTGIYSEDDYGQGEDGDIYYVNSLHLVGDNNDSEQSSRVLEMYKSNDSTWVAYIPEYDNSVSDGDTCYIELEFECEDDDEGYNFSDNIVNPFNVYFSADGSSEETPIDIQRNKLYRFKVSGPTVSVGVDYGNSVGWGWYSKKR